MSIARKCPYENENCKYEIFAGEPIFKKCKFCSRNSGNKGKQIEGVTMFEKEAEEYYNDVTVGTFQESVEFFEDAVMTAYKDGAEFGYNKANEWHYVKDGDLPTHSYRVLVYTDEGVGFGLYGLDDKKWHTYDTGFDVIAWKEIVLPELLKEIK